MPRRRFPLPTERNRFGFGRRGSRAVPSWERMVGLSRYGEAPGLAAGVGRAAGPVTPEIGDERRRFVSFFWVKRRGPDRRAPVPNRIIDTLAGPGAARGRGFTSGGG